MIVRKPYAFLIKNFRKIHVVLLILGLFIAYRLIDVNNFVTEFMRYGVYDSYANPVTSHISGFLLFIIFITTVGSGALIVLLRYKKKPWKAYLVPFIEYFALFLVLNIIKGFFTSFKYDIATTDLRFSRDLLVIFLVAQIPAIGIFLMRTLGLDTKKFNFSSDEEFLELNEEDREEVEISFNIDVNTFKRLYKRLFRNIKYFYEEHKIICRAAVIVVGVVFLYSVYKFIFITNRSYSQGDSYSVNGYTIKVNNSYFTDKSYNGEVISKSSNFVIVEFTITNNSAPRKINMSNFHLKNSTEDYVTTEKTFAEEFRDLGTTYDSVRELKRDETLNLIVIYKVDKKLRKDGFVLYYQENNGGTLRKIKLKIKDLSTIKNGGTFKLQDDLELNLNPPEVISFDSYEITDSAEYVVRKCTTIGCASDVNEFNTNGEYKILAIDFGSDTYQVKNMIDFLTKYGRIVYKDSSGSVEDLEVENSIPKAYYGKTVYLKVPNDITEASEISFEITVRNKKYVYKLV